MHFIKHLKLNKIPYEKLLPLTQIRLNFNFLKEVTNKNLYHKLYTPTNVCFLKPEPESDNISESQACRSE